MDIEEEEVAEEEGLDKVFVAYHFMFSNCLFFLKILMWSFVKGGDQDGNREGFRGGSKILI